MNTHHAFHGRAGLRQAGLTLVELLVAMVVGLSVIGAGLAMYVSSGASSSASSQITQMSEDANTALSVLRTHVAMAGYSRPIGTTSTGLTKLYAGPAIFGCQNGLSTASKSQLMSAGIELTCNPGAASANETLIVAYEADVNNTVPTSANTGTDCLGSEIPAQKAPTGGNYYVAENRFFLNAAGALSCQGNGSATPQPMVDNIADFSVMYGVARPDPGSPTVPGTSANRYLTATEVGTMTDANWNNVVSVRLCVIVRSEDNALDTVAPPYVDCHGNTITPSTWGSSSKPDKRSYRMFTSTVVLHNRAQQAME